MSQFLITGGGSGSGSATPGGSSGDIQYNNAGALGGFADGTSHQLLHGGKTFGAVDVTTEITGVVPAANGGVADLRTAAKGYFWGVAGTDDSDVGATATIISPTGNNVLLVFQFVLESLITVRKVVFCNGATVTASATASFGIYDISGNRLIDSGTFSTAVASQNLSNTLGSPVTLTPGIYWFAQACTNSTNDARGRIGTGVFSGTIVGTARNLNTTRQGTAANAYSGGVLPATLGVVTGVTNREPVAVLFEA